MYIETRFFDNGKAMAKLHKGFAYPKLDANPDKCDFYLESINPHPNMKVAKSKHLQDGSTSSYDFESLQEWIEEMCVELDDITPIVLALDSGGWVDISKYC